ncbi:MAG: indolepyruvate ferredoxin oxidoreductase family protein [Gammaproteobacteria bacterium]|nr:indolepyruvate ferredoxin oxidoreductase family protein [Gammaproteobacteria bacterium]
MIFDKNTGADMRAKGLAKSTAPRGSRAVDSLTRARYRTGPGVAYLTGIQAIARLPLDQRRLDDRAGFDTAGFISGYRGSPLGGLDQELWRLSGELAAHRIVFQPGVNEDLAATAVWGSQQVGLFPGARHEGVYGLWYGKAPGLDRSSDAVRHANAAGTSPRGGVLLVVGDDHACKSSTLPSASEFALRDLAIPILAPADVQDVLDYGLLGWALSRYSGCWTGLIALADVMDSALDVEVSLDRHRFVDPPHAEAFPHIRLQDSPTDQEARLETKLRLVRMFASANSVDRIVTTVASPSLVLVTAGKTYADMREALARLGLESDAQLVRAGIRLVKLGMTWPLDNALVHEFCSGARRVLVIEEKRSFIEDQLRSILFGRPVEILGKRSPPGPACDEDGKAQDGTLLPATGELDVPAIATAIRALLPAETDASYLEEIAHLARTLPGDAGHSKDTRKPVFCAGCPHNASTRVPEGSRAAAGIGCHYMAQWMDRNTGTPTHMGAEGANWIGQAPFTDENHIFANIGDGTFFHSGILAIRAAVASGANITYKVLLNDAVAMTGGQPVDGPLTVDDVVAQVRAEGVAAVRVVSDGPARHRRAGFRVAPRDSLDAVQRELRATPGCTVLVYEQTCAAELRRRRKRGLVADPDIRVVINDAVCEGCGDCSVQSNCVAVEPLQTEFGVKRTINQTACNKDLSCIDGFCPALVSLAGARLKSPDKADHKPLVPLPVASSPAASVLIAGVGGTGVVTVSQILGTAAHLDGNHVSTLDMTGLAQKGGAVVSHVRISPAGTRHPPTRIPAMGADTLIGADAVTAASIDVLGLTSPRTSVILNSHLAPTAEFVLRQRQCLDFGKLEKRLKRRVRRLVTVDANAAAKTLFGSSTSANVFLLGYAFQAGGIPVSLTALKRAITLNGVAVEQNLAAFHHGRNAAHRRESSRAGSAVRPSASGAMQLPRSTGLDDRIATRSAFLSEYQDQALAARYEDLVKRIRTLESRVKPGSRALAEAAAESYFRLLAVKDEYEVARLFTSESTGAGSDFAAKLDARFEPGFKTTFYFAPPVFTRKGPTGRPAKIAVGGWIMPLLRILARLRRCRGSVFDPFRYSAERRLERKLLTGFEADIQTILARLDATNFDAAVALARLPAAIKGFGPVKEASAEAALQRRSLYLAQLHAPPGLSRPRECSREASPEEAIA